MAIKVQSKKKKEKMCIFPLFIIVYADFRCVIILVVTFRISLSSIFSQNVTATPFFDTLDHNERSTKSTCDPFASSKNVQVQGIIIFQFSRVIILLFLNIWRRLEFQTSLSEALRSILPSRVAFFIT
jgi:hypothetical protein